MILTQIQVSYFPRLPQGASAVPVFFPEHVPRGLHRSFNSLDITSADLGGLGWVQSFSIFKRSAVVSASVWEP